MVAKQNQEDIIDTERGSTAFLPASDEDRNEQQEVTVVSTTPSDRAMNLSLNAVRFAVFCDAVTAFILDVNYVFMAYPGAHEDSFPDTKPFGFNSATYFVAMTAMLGAAIGSTFIGHLSDRIGRKPCLLACLLIGAVGAVCNYLARHTFWGFCASNFTQGLFAGSSPVAMAYVSDVKRTRKEKDEEIGIIVAIVMLGATGGGICSILLQKHGLFTPLFLGAALNVVAAIMVYRFVHEPRKGSSSSELSLTSDEEEEEENAPKTIDKKILANIIGGALFDNIGSAGLLPIAMSPLAFTQFYVNFLEQGEDPIMSQSAYKWISVMAALTVIPGAAMSQVSFDKIGAPISCVLGNIFTGIITFLCMTIAYIEPATYGTFVAFIATLYIGFPITVISQLTTGPMLDMIAPANKRGFIQGLNDSVMKFAMAISPYLLGLIADNVGVKETMWTCIGVSFAAAFVNLPLVFVKALKRPPKRVSKHYRALKGEDKGLIGSAMKGEWISSRAITEINDKRMQAGQPMLTLPLLPYHEDKHNLDILQKEARSDFEHMRSFMRDFLNDPTYQNPQKRAELAAQYEDFRPCPKDQEKLANGLSKWMADYLLDNGYPVDDCAIQYKQMFMAAFPPLTKDKQITADNIEEVCVKYTKVLDKYLADDYLTGNSGSGTSKTTVDC